MTHVVRSPDCEHSDTDQRAEQIALAFLGAGDLPDALLSEGAVWDRTGGAITGRRAIQQMRATLPACDSIRIDQVVSHGKAATTTGLLRRPGEGTRLFCHVIKFASTDRGEIVQVVSFEHAGSKHDR